MHKTVTTRTPASRALRLAAILLVAAVAVILIRAATGRSSGHKAGSVAGQDGTSHSYEGYVGSASCRECHEFAHTLWAKSDHGRAQRLPNPADEAAAFEPSRLLKHGTQQTLFRGTNGCYEFITAGLHGTNEVFQVREILANNPLRQMLAPFPGGRLQASEAAWDPAAKEWFNVYGNEDRKPGEWGHWTGRGMNWNSMCAACHNTAVHKNYDPATDSYRTTQFETGVSCEACHGPLKTHVDWARAHRGHKGPDPTFPKHTPQQIMHTCASCHTRRAELTGEFKPGDSFFDHYSMSIVDHTDLFYPDGQIRDEDYEYTSFMGSKMHQAGITCLDCHPRALHLPRLKGNDMCLRCHAGGLQKAPIINPVEHSHHPHGSTGNECVACHMPTTVYMQRDARHDHGLTIPDPLLTRQSGIPNACERCHGDKGTEWNLKAVEQWYGTNMNRPYRTRAQTIARARQGDASARDPLMQMLATDENPYWQAVAAGLLQDWTHDSRVVTALAGQLQHTNPLVRQSVLQSLGPLAQAGRADIAALVEKRLGDPSRNVRIEAARHLTATLDTNSIAGRDYMRFLLQISDQPLGQMQAGLFLFQRGDATNALKHFHTATRWDPYSAGLRHELAILHSQLGQMPEAVAELEQAVKLAPNEAEFHFKLALALNETGDTGRLMSELETAVKCDPRHARAWYNLGLARNGAGNVAGAIQALATAESADPADPRAPYARATLLAKQGRQAEARAAVRRALEADPNFTPARAMLDQLGE